MQNLKHIAAGLGLALTLALVMPQSASAQSQKDREKMAAQVELTASEAALASAEASKAATLAPVLFNEATSRLEAARRDWNSSDLKVRNLAVLRAIEAGHAARAAEAQASLVAANNEIRTLRTEITNAGGSPVAVTLYDPPSTISRGASSMDRVIVAENALSIARGAGGDSVAPTLLTHAEAILKTARMLAGHSNQNQNADHLAFVAEMLARRAELMARRNAIATMLPELRDTRNRLSAQTPVTVPVTVPVPAAQFNADREARIAAERNLDLVLRRYEEALSQGSRSSGEVQALRRQVDEQSEALRALRERERAGEASRANEIQALERSLARERSEGQLTADVLAQREEELRRQREELLRLQREREESERLRLEAERVRTAAIAEAERLREETQREAERVRAETQQQTAELRDQVEAERARATQTEAQLAQARDELARRDAANRQRLEAMQQEIAKLAETRTSERGFVVTLPGLFFDSGKSVLKAGARNALTKIADQLRINENTRIAVEGHTDSVGSEELNQALSEKRAAAVRDHLVARGVPAERISTSGLGETAPVATNDTAAGRQQNRRVELIITTHQQ